MLVTILVVLIILALALYAVGLLPALDGNIKTIIQIVLVAIAIIYILQASGLA